MIMNEIPRENIPNESISICDQWRLKGSLRIGMVAKSNGDLDFGVYVRRCKITVV